MENPVELCASSPPCKLAPSLNLPPGQILRSALSKFLIFCYTECHREGTEAHRGKLYNF